MNTTPDINFLRGLMPKAVIKVEITNPPTYEVDLRHAKITDKEHDDLFPPIKEYFGKRLSERYSMCTGHFKIYLKKETDSKLN